MSDDSRKIRFGLWYDFRNPPQWRQPAPSTSKVTVEIELRPHLTVQGEAGQSGSAGIGLNYNYDY